MAEEVTEQLEFPYREASGFRTVTVDSAIVGQVFDGVGTTVRVTFTRLDQAVSSEIVIGRKIEAGFQAAGAPSLQTNLQKTQEIAILMRPDHAFNIAKALFENLARLEPDQYQRYKLSRDGIRAVAELFIKSGASDATASS